MTATDPRTDNPSPSEEVGGGAPSRDELAALSVRLREHADLCAQWDRWELGTPPPPPLLSKDTAVLLLEASAEIEGLRAKLDRLDGEAFTYARAADRACEEREALRAQLSQERQQREAAEGALRETRRIALNAMIEMRVSGESREMCARWISERLAAVYRARALTSEQKEG